MFEGFVNVNVTNDRTRGLLESLKKLSEMDVLVGIPQEESSREGEKITNAELAFIHTNGSPLRGIPARPIIEPAIEDQDNQKLIAEQLQKAAEDAFDGNIEAAKVDLEKAGMLGQNAARDWFINSKNGWAPNSPLTIKRKGSDRPLIDTGELRKSIVYVIRKKG